MTLQSSDLPTSAAAAYENLTHQQQAAFTVYYNQRKRSTGLMLLLAIIFPIQLFMLGKVGLGVIFWLTGGGLGVWWVIEWFLTPSRVRDYNAGVAADGLSLISSGGGAITTTDTPVQEEE